MAKKKICLDAGHGLYTSGKRCMKSLDPNQTREWVLNDRIADKLEAMLKGYDCEVMRSDDTTGQKDISLADRVAAANNWGADVFVSIHHNAGINGGTGGGTVVYHYCGSDAGVAMASKLYNAVVASTGLVGNRSSKVKKTAYYVLKNTKMRAYLIENGFMDSATDVPIILTDAHAEKTARGILNCLVAEYGLKGSAVVETPKTDDPILYCVQVGAFSKKENAAAMKDKLKAAGFDTYMVQVNGLHKVQLGAFSKVTNARNMLAKVKAAGFDAFIATKKA